MTLQIQLPPALQNRFGGRRAVHRAAVVCREENFDGQPVHRIGARFLGETEAQARSARR